MRGSITIRIWLKDFRKVIKVFPWLKREKTARYFERLAEAMQNESVAKAIYNYLKS